MLIETPETNLSRGMRQLNGAQRKEQHKPSADFGGTGLCVPIGENHETTIYRAYVEGGYTMLEIAEYLGLHYSGISLALKKHEKGQ